MTVGKQIKTELADKPFWKWLLILPKLMVILVVMLLGLIAPWVVLFGLLPRLLKLPSNWELNTYALICLGVGYWASHWGHKFARQEEAAKESRNSAAQVRAFFELASAKGRSRG